MADDDGIPGCCYLLHFDGPFGHARHYLGWSENDVLGRINYHLKGRGCRLVNAAVNAGTDIYLVRLWKGATRNDERRLKRRASTRYCPVCSDPMMNDGFGPRWLQKKLAA